MSEPPHASVPVAESWFAGGGEVGALMRSLDWSTTSLGAPESWPQSLRVAVSICLGSRFPIVLYWGPRLVTIYNDAYAPILARKHPWALGRACAEVWPEIWDVIAPMLQSVMATGEATWSEDQLLLLERHGYTEECYFSFSFSPVRGESGGVDGIFTAVIEHTERVIVERRLSLLGELAASAAEAKSDVEACERAAISLSRSGKDIPFALIYLLDAKGRSARLAATAGLARGGAASPEEISLDEEAVSWPLAHVAATGEATFLMDVGHRYADLPSGPWPVPPHSACVVPIASVGHERLAGFLVAGVSPRRAFDDDYRAFLGLVVGHIATAIADARALEAERARAEALAEIDRAKTAFFSNVSHEFRTPLTLMLGPVEDILATRGEGGHPENRELLEVVRRNGLRLQKLVNTLLDFSRIEAGRIQATYEPADLGPLTAGLVSNFRSACERAGLRLLTDCPPLDEPVYVDRDMWEKIVLNLVSNAFKFTVEGEIAVTVRQRPGAIELTVRDTGTGIPAEEIPHIFQRFHRVKNPRARTYEGTGIGLALVQELVKLHGGTLKAESVLGQGSTFLVSVPTGTAHLPPDRIQDARMQTSTGLNVGPYVEEALRWFSDTDSRLWAPSGEERETDVARASPSGVPPARRDANNRRARILWADDNADMREYVRQLLSTNYDVEAVADGKALLNAARVHRPDLVLADVMMPLLDGFELLRELRADPEMRTLPVILLSARAGEEAHVEGLAAGADDYLIKPFAARELLARVAARLEIARVRRQAESTERQAKQAAEAGNRAKDEFLAMLGHELRNPLGAIGGAVNVLNLKGQVDDETAELRGIIHRQTAHLTRLLEDLLDITRLNTGKIELQLRPLDLKTVAENALRSLAEGGKAAQHAISLTGETLWVQGDPTRLQQIVFNVLDNAVKYTPPGGRVTITVKAEGSFAVLRVVDTGVGMTPDTVARAFEPFVQAHSTPDQVRSGLGLGLTLVKRLVELHGGTVAAHSPGVGQGVEVLVRIPLTDARRAPELTPPTEALVRPRRVLVIDDNADMRTTLRMLLELGGHQVDEAAEGVQGLELLSQLRPDVAFIDLGLPGRDGYELAQAARSALGGAALYLVALTGYGQPEDRRRAFEVGFNAYLVKPVYHDDLARVLGAAPGEG